MKQLRKHVTLRRHARIYYLWFAMTALLCGATPANTPAPDFTDVLRDDLPITAWFSPDHTRGFLQVGEVTSKIFPMWKVRVADLDGDGTKEVLMGIWSHTPRHQEPEPHRTIWVIGWNDASKTFEPLWRGSALARPLRDFEIRNGQLMAFEHEGQRCFETLYQWTGFGFTSNAGRPTECGAP